MDTFGTFGEYGFFTVTEDHLKLLRRANVTWNDAAYEGAPEIDVKRPYGSKIVLGDIAEIVDGITWDERKQMDDDGTLDDFYEGHHDQYLKLHRETEVALQIALRVGYFKAGSYVCDRYQLNWRPAEQAEIPSGFTYGPVDKAEDQVKSYKAEDQVKLYWVLPGDGKGPAFGPTTDGARALTYAEATRGVLVSAPGTYVRKART